MFNGYLAGMSNGTRSVWGSGMTPSRLIQLILVNISTLGNATDFGDSQRPNTGMALERRINTTAAFSGGNSGSNIDTIETKDITSSGNNIDFGDLTSATEKKSIKIEVY